VLDIGCGAGRHALYLQHKGFNVTAIDNSPLTIKVCKLRGLRKAKVLPIEKLSFASNSFDTIIMMWGNFGLLGNPSRLRLILKKFYRITSKQARIVADVNDPYRTAEPDHLRYHRQNTEKGRIPGQLRLRVRYKAFIGPWFDYLFVSQAEMKKILFGTGWSIAKIFPTGTSAYIVLLNKT